MIQTWNAFSSLPALGRKIVSRPDHQCGLNRILLPDDWMTQTWLALKPELRYGHCPAQTYKDNEPEEGHGHFGRRGRWTMASCRQLLSPTFWPSAGPWIWFGRAGQTSRQSTCPEPLALWREILMINVPLSCHRRNTSQNILVESEVVSAILAVLVIVLDSDWGILTGFTRSAKLPAKPWLQTGILEITCR